MSIRNIFGKKSIAATLAAAIAAATPGAAFARGDGGGDGGTGPKCGGNCGGTGSSSNGGGHEVKQDQDLCFAIPQPQAGGTVSFATFRAPQGLIDSARPIPNTLGDVSFEGNGFQEFLKNRSIPKSSGFFGLGGDKTPIINVMWDDKNVSDATFVPKCDEKLKALVSEFGGYTPAPVVEQSTTAVPTGKPLIYFKGGVVKPQ